MNNNHNPIMSFASTFILYFYSKEKLRDRLLEFHLFDRNIQDIKNICHILVLDRHNTIKWVICQVSASVCLLALDPVSLNRTWIHHGEPGRKMAEEKEQETGLAALEHVFHLLLLKSFVVFFSVQTLLAFPEDVWLEEAETTSAEKCLRQDHRDWLFVAEMKLAEMKLAGVFSFLSVPLTSSDHIVLVAAFAWPNQTEQMGGLEQWLQ